MSKFKTGDRVVRILERHRGRNVEIGTVGTVLDSGSSSSTLVRFDGHDRDNYNHKHLLELEHIYNSPLYRALK